MLGVITAKAPIPYGSTVPLMARIRGAGALVTQATVSSISYLLWDLTTDTRVQPSSGTRTLTVSSVVSDSPAQNLAIWNVDSRDRLGPDATWGPNLRYDVPASDVGSTEAGHRVRATLTITFTDGSVLSQLFEWEVADSNT